MAYIGHNVPDNAEKEEEGEKRESNLFHHTTHSRSICRCDLEPQCTTGGYTCSHRLWSVLCGPKLASFWHSCEQVGKIPIVGLSFYDVPEKVRGGSSDDEVRTYHQLAVALGTTVRIKFMIELNIGWPLLSVVVASALIIALREAHVGLTRGLGAGSAGSYVCMYVCMCTCTCICI